MIQEEKALFKIHNDSMKRMREKRRLLFENIVGEIEKLGFKVRKINAFQYRINERLDIFPSNKKYLDIKIYKGGSIRGIKFSDFIVKYFNDIKE